MKKNNRKGFTLAELLIVVAIIAVLVAIAIPVFTTQLEKSRDSVTASNIRAAYAEAASKYLTDGSDVTTAEQVSIDGVEIKGRMDNDYFDDLDLPFDVSAIADALDNGSTTDTINVTFTWTDDGDTCTATKKS